MSKNAGGEGKEYKKLVQNGDGGPIMLQSVSVSDPNKSHQDSPKTSHDSKTTTLQIESEAQGVVNGHSNVNINEANYILSCQASTDDGSCGGNYIPLSQMETAQGTPGQGTPIQTSPVKTA